MAKCRVFYVIRQAYSVFRPRGRKEAAIGGSTNAPIHFNAIARHIGVKLDNNDWEKIGYDIPLLVNLQPAGEYRGEEFQVGQFSPPWLSLPCPCR